MGSLRFQLITPERIVFDEEIERLILPTTTGEIAILPGHVALVSQLGHGEMIIATPTGEHAYAVRGGFVSVEDNVVRVLAESADHADDIDLVRAEAARQEAQKLRDRAQNEEEIAVATGALERALAQLKVAGRKRRHH